MSLTEFEEQYARHAKEEKQTYDALPVETLLDDIKNKRYGDHYQIWVSLVARTDFRQAGLILLEVLESDANPTVRSHCAHTFISLAHLDDRWTAERLSAERQFPVKDNLQEVRRIVEDRMKLEDQRSKESWLKRICRRRLKTS